MIVGMVMVFVHFRMDINTKDNGLKEKNMVMEWKYFLMDIVLMEFLKMINL